MLLVIIMGLLVVTVPLFRGRLTALAELDLRGTWSLVVALGIQVLIFVVIPSEWTALHPTLHVGSYLLVAVFLWKNAGVSGMWLIAMGGCMNLVALAANGGVMPASPEALAAAGLSGIDGTFQNSAAAADPLLPFLGDLFAVPPAFPFPNVFSVGDLCMVLGTGVALHRLTGSRLFPSGDGAMLSLRHHRDFVRLWGSQAISNLGDWVYSIAVATTLVERTGDAVHLAGVLVVQVAPSAVAGVFVGPWIDRWWRKKLMIGSDVLRGLAVGSLLLVDSPSILHFYVVAACLGFFEAVFQPSLQASLPNLVPREKLVAANALVSGTFHLAVMVGPMVGGILVATLGVTPTFALNAGSFVLSAALIAWTWIPRPLPSEKPSSPLGDLVEGFRYCLATPLVRGILVVTGLVMLAAAIKAPLEPLFVFRSLGLDARALGLLGGAWGLGMVVGSIMAPAAARRWARPTLLWVSIGVVGVSVLTASFLSTLAPVVLLWVAAGVGNGLGSVAYESLLQERTPDRLRGRVMAASEAALEFCFLVGAFGAGWLGSGIGVRGAYVAAGALFLLGALASRRLIPAPPRTPSESARTFGFEREAAPQPVSG